MDSTSLSVEHQALSSSQPGRVTPEQRDRTGAGERVSGLESGTSQTSQLSIVPSSTTSTAPWLRLIGGRKMLAYLVSVLFTALLAIVDKASTEVLFAIQSALAAFIGGNAAEHKFSKTGDKK